MCVPWVWERRTNSDISRGRGELWYRALPWCVARDGTEGECSSYDGECSWWLRMEQPLTTKLVVGWWRAARMIDTQAGCKMPSQTILESKPR